MCACRLKQVERPVGVDREVGLRLARRPIVGRLGCGVDDQLDRTGVLAEYPIDRLGIPDVGVLPVELWVVGDQPLGHLGGGGLRTEEASPHIVLDADNVETLGDEVLDALRADQAPSACDDRNRHSCYSLPPAGMSMFRAWAIRASSAAIHSWMSARTCSGISPRAPLIQAKEPCTVR